MKLKTYPKYKDSGIQWIGKIPEGWNAERFKIRFKSKKGKIPENLEEINGESYLPYLSMEYLRGTEEGVLFSNDPKALKVEKDDLLLLWDGSNAGEFISAKKGYLSSTMVKLSIKNMDKSYSKFLCSAFEPMLRDLTIGMGIPHVNGDTLGNIRIPIFEIQDQQKIAAFLDTQTLKINKTIEKNKKLIELLKERRTSLINHVVIKGLDPNVKLKDSGIEWVGKIPGGWKVSRLKNGVLIKYGFSLSESERIDGKFNVFGSNGIVGIHNKAKTEGKTIIIGRKGSYGKINLSEKSCFPIDTTYFIDKSCTNFNLQYLFYLLTQLKLDETSRDSAVPGLSREVAYNKIIPYVSKTEQIQIAEYLDKATAKIDKTIKLIEKKIKLLQEFKKSLIHHVVTGKVDVRGVEA